MGYTRYWEYCMTHGEGRRRSSIALQSGCVALGGRSVSTVALCALAPRARLRLIANLASSTWSH